MANITIKATAVNGLSGADEFYYRQENEWRNVGPQMLVWLNAKLTDLTDSITKVAAKKEGGEITATFDMTTDGVAVPPLIVSGITRREMSKFQRRFHNVGDELIRIGEERADAKDREHRQRHGHK